MWQIADYNVILFTGKVKTFFFGDQLHCCVIIDDGIESS